MNLIVDHQLSYIISQVTNFECGGYSIGISCSLLLADLLLFKENNFLQKWAKIHSNIMLVANNNVPKTPIFYLPNLKKDGRPVTGFNSSSPSKNSGQTFIFKIGAKSSVVDNTTLALLCVEEAERQLGNKMASEFPLLLNQPNNVVKVEKCSMLHEATTLNPKLISLGITSEGWDDLGADDVEFLAGNQPLHVSHWIGSISGGLVLAIPSFFDHEDLCGGKIMVTIPKENIQIY